MSDDEADPELLELLRQTLGAKPRAEGITSDTKVLRDAEYIYSNAIDVAIDRNSTVAAAQSIWDEMQRRSYSTATWSEHELHPKDKDESTLNFIFTMDLLNFSFWSEMSEDSRWKVLYRWKYWTGYWALVACLQRALEEGVSITDPRFWVAPGVPLGDSEEYGERDHQNAIMDDVETEVPVFEQAGPLNGENATQQPHDDREPATADDAQEAVKVADSGVEGVTDDVSGLRLKDQEVQNSAKATQADRHNTVLDRAVLEKVFRGDGEEPIPLLDERLKVLQEAGQVLQKTFDGSVVKLIERAEGSAGKLVNLLAHHFDCFRDEAEFDGKKVRFLKRAQIFVADVWAAFDGKGYGAFDDIDCITMFADYRVPQQLHSLGCFNFSPSLNHAIRSQVMFAPGGSWECQLRGCSIWVVELIRRQIKMGHPDADVNAILIDFFLYDLAKEREKAGDVTIPHHRTRSIWY